MICPEFISIWRLSCRTPSKHTAKVQNKTIIVCFPSCALELLVGGIPKPSRREAETITQPDSFNMFNMYGGHVEAPPLLRANTEIPENLSGISPICSSKRITKRMATPGFTGVTVRMVMRLRLSL
jgi:hypothetical protein